MTDTTFHYALLLGLGGLVVALWRIGNAYRASVALRALAQLEMLTKRYHTLADDDPLKWPFERLSRLTIAQYERVCLGSAARALAASERTGEAPSEPAAAEEGHTDGEPAEPEVPPEPPAVRAPDPLAEPAPARSAEPTSAGEYARVWEPVPNPHDLVDD